jgi:hypothetical protein
MHHSTARKNSTTHTTTKPSPTLRTSHVLPKMTFADKVLPAQTSAAATIPDAMLFAASTARKVMLQQHATATLQTINIKPTKPNQVEVMETLPALLANAVEADAPYAFIVACLIP